MIDSLFLVLDQLSDDRIKINSQIISKNFKTCNFHYKINYTEANICIGGFTSSSNWSSSIKKECVHNLFLAPMYYPQRHY